MAQFSEIFEKSSSFSVDKNQFKFTESENSITIPSVFMQDTKVSTAISSLVNNNTTPSFLTQLSDPTAQTYFKTTFHP